MASGTTTSETQEDSKPEDLSLDVLRNNTKNFSQLGGRLRTNDFGTLYKGTDDQGRQMIVKKLTENQAVARDKAFVNEVENLKGLRHPNIVRLVGYHKALDSEISSAEDDTERFIICYEFLQKGSLPDNGEYTNIDWSTRFEIIKGVCQGLLYLHERRIIHMDLKPENIWLDENMVPKIVNFGLSMSFGADKTERKTEVVGSVGYIAPEYRYKGEISAQTDIYSLGIVMIEITTGEKNRPIETDQSARKYIDKICNDWTEEHIATMYPLSDADCLQQVNACIQIGLECVEINPANRPSIEKVLDKLYARCAS